MFKYNQLNPIAQVGLKLFTDNYQTENDINESDAVLVRSAAMHELKLTNQVKAIARAGAGVNNIPLDKYANEGIVVFNTPGANANGVKELVIAGLLLASRDIIGGVSWASSIKDDSDVAKLVEKGKSKFAGNEIEGKRIGIIGLGAIGVLVANAAKRLGMEVYGYDPYISVEHAWNLSRDIIAVKSREEIYKECDYISVHVPLLEDTKKMINSETIKLMRDGVVLLNFARDLLVDDDAMEVALASGKVKKYVTDFPNNKTAGMQGVIAIPHLGASTEESEDNCAVMAVKQIKNYLEYGNIKNSVNYPDCDAGLPEIGKRITINHRNIPNMLTQFTGVFARENILNLVNKSRGEYAYTVIDIENTVDPTVADKLASIEGVLKYRII